MRTHILRLAVWAFAGRVPEPFPSNLCLTHFSSTALPQPVTTTAKAPIPARGAMKAQQAAASVVVVRRDANVAPGAGAGAGAGAEEDKLDNTRSFAGGEGKRKGGPGIGKLKTKKKKTVRKATFKGTDVADNVDTVKLASAARPKKSKGNAGLNYKPIGRNRVTKGQGSSYCPACRRLIQDRICIFMV